MGAFLFLYVLPGLFVGFVLGAETSDSRRYSEASAALGFLGGLLWPLTLLVGLCWLILRAATGLARSAVALWDVTIGDALAWRRARVKLPRARKVQR